MKFFIDTANLEQIQEAYDLGVLDGVTTNPSLMAKEGIKGTQNQREHYIKICKIVNGDVSAEVIATDYEGMIREGEELAALNPHWLVDPSQQLYPEVANQYNVNPFQVVRSIDGFACESWHKNAAFLRGLTYRPLTTAPTSAQFLRILTHYLRSGAV